MIHPIGLYSLVFLGALACTLALVPVMRRVALALNIVDRPSEARKIHRAPVPYLGGVAFYVGFIVLALILHFQSPQYGLPNIVPMCIVGTLILIIGIYDDICDLASWKKLIMELVLITALFFWGVRATQFSHPLGGAIHVGWIAIIITALWIVGVMNAINFSDGLDGLAAGLVFICAAAIFAIAFKNGRISSCILMLYLMGTTLGFLWYNFHPANIFMGDAGALFLGYVLGTSTLMEEQKGVAVIALAVPMVVLAVPILDTVLSFLRRLKRARTGGFFKADSDHLHHRLLKLGLSQVQVVLALYFIAAWMGLMAFVLSGLPDAYRFLVLLLAGMAILFGVAVLHFIEGLAAKNSPDPVKPLE